MPHTVLQNSEIYCFLNAILNQNMLVHVFPLQQITIKIIYFDISLSVISNQQQPKIHVYT